MTKFNPENKKVLTHRECLIPAMRITEQEDADQYFRDYMSYVQKSLDEDPRDDDMTAADICRANLGYFAGYFDYETRVRVESLFTCKHPIFGRVEKQKPTAQQAFDMGLLGITKTNV